MNLGDIVERNPGNTKPPAPPKAPKPKTLPKAWRPARTRGPGIAPAQAPVLNNSSYESSQPPLSEAEQIHIDNVKKLAAMTPEQIAREREEIMDSMDPAVLEGLLKRIEQKEAQDEKESMARSTHVSAVSDNKNMGDHRHEAEETLSEARKAEPKVPLGDNPLDGTNVTDRTLENDSVHFPSAPDELRKYFPDLPVETEKMAWMQPISAEEEHEYSAELTSLAPSELRFDFNGNLVTPRQSRTIDPSLGLHHHGDAPSAAGYTILELAHLARSSNSSQRSMAIQTLGRTLHKLYTGCFRKSNDLQSGLEQLVESGRVMDTLYEAAGEKTRSLTVRTHATEALWLIETVRPVKAEPSGSEESGSVQREK